MVYIRIVGCLHKLLTKVLYSIPGCFYCASRYFCLRLELHLLLGPHGPLGGPPPLLQNWEGRVVNAPSILYSGPIWDLLCYPGRGLGPEMGRKPHFPARVSGAERPLVLELGGCRGGPNSGSVDRPGGGVLFVWQALIWRCLLHEERLVGLLDARRRPAVTFHFTRQPHRDVLARSAPLGGRTRHLRSKLWEGSMGMGSYVRVCGSFGQGAVSPHDNDVWLFSVVRRVSMSSAKAVGR